MPATAADNSSALYRKEVTVLYHETDQHGFIKAVALLNHLQSTAGEHATGLGVSVHELRKSGHTWVLSRVHLAMERYPRGGETFHITTWPSARDSLFTVRDFELTDSQGQVIGTATTSWAVLNLATRRPVKLDEVLPRFPVTARRALDDPFSTLPVFETATKELRLPVLRGDLDINRHVNNTVYVGWALETVPDEIDSRCRLASIEVGYRAEALYGESIIARIGQSEQAGCCLHRIDSAGDGRELARLRTVWVER
jgi:acyl-ACP thioesterase